MLSEDDWIPLSLKKRVLTMKLLQQEKKVG